jgi:putative spermidine/putrescine transport system ATP-binding protein
MSNAGYLALESLTLGHGGTTVVESLNFTVGKGELVALLGPSGCGKTTTMRAIAGLLMPRAGTIRLDGREITRMPANRRDVGLVFQSYALFPHLSVAENLAFGLRLQRLPEAEIARKVEAMLDTVDLVGLHGRLPRELSGGQQQRVALARAVIVEPRLLLLDEPLSNLDAKLRIDMRGELQRLQHRLGITMVYVTHDQTEALALADRVAVMRAGRIEQVGDPETVFRRPATAFVASFMGFDNVFAVAEGKLEGPDGRAVPFSNTSALDGGAHALAWRPRDVTLGVGPYRGRVAIASYLGDTMEYILDTPLGSIKASVNASAVRYASGEELAFDLPVAGAAQLTDGPRRNRN